MVWRVIDILNQPSNYAEWLMDSTIILTPILPEIPFSKAHPILGIKVVTGL